MNYYNDYNDDYYPIDTPLTFSEEELDDLYGSPPIGPSRPSGGLADPVNRRMLMLLLFAILMGGVMTFIRTNGSGGAGGQPQTTTNNGPALQGAAAAAPVQGVIAPLFTREIKHWETKILEWSLIYGVEPNIVATVMQIESCGDPQAVSGAGAQSLFQVMPFHFAAGENSMDPDTNAKRGMIFMADLLSRSNGDVALALAGYNGGPSVMSRSWESWPNETQRYFRWGSGIYADASTGNDTSETLQQWLAAGGASLCQQAASRLGL
jgi:hypothetical protein